MWLARSSRRTLRPLWTPKRLSARARGSAVSASSCFGDGSYGKDGTFDRRCRSGSSLVGRGGPIAVEPGRRTFARGASLNVVARPSGGFTARGFAASGASPPETHAFQAETRRLLDIVTNSLYTDKEVFVRELVSNASYALEKCRHQFLVRGQDPGSLTIDITTDEEQGTFSIADTGLGMSKEDLIANLGVIARSGSRAFVEEIDGSSSDDSIQKQNKQTRVPRKASSASSAWVSTARSW